MRLVLGGDRLLGIGPVISVRVRDGLGLPLRRSSFSTRAAAQANTVGDRECGSVCVCVCVCVMVCDGV